MPEIYDEQTFKDINNKEENIYQKILKALEKIEENTRKV